ncbi:hypothetical protein [Anditalea andensis]|uniref:Outer membrane protein beta-barrel domain-containing protein n=1 Tax=Anditalea andensis TaxID=1048983 RepID=A0A074KX91_9BACT|nr:hypothetical protein [Anditalea andensis]KEO73574.1 hypothetical protein EL17_11785 [Anditalea andensis]
MKKIYVLIILFCSIFLDIQAQEYLHFTDFYLSGGYKNQPYTALNQKLTEAGYQSFGSNMGTIGIGINHFNSYRWGFFAESEYNLNSKRSSNDELNYRYMPLHITAGVQYIIFKYRPLSQWRFYPRIAVYAGSTSLDLISNDLNLDFDENLMGAMNTSFLYQRNYGLNLSLNADKVIAAFIKPTTQVGIYSRMGIQVGYFLNVINSRTRLRRNFKPDLRDDFAIHNAPEFDPSAFYVKINIGLGKFKREIRTDRPAAF